MRFEQGQGEVVRGVTLERLIRVGFRSNCKVARSRDAQLSYHRPLAASEAHDNACGRADEQQEARH